MTKTLKEILGTLNTIIDEPSPGIPVLDYGLEPKDAPAVNKALGALEPLRQAITANGKEFARVKALEDSAVAHGRKSFEEGAARKDSLYQVFKSRDERLKAALSEGVESTRASLRAEAFSPPPGISPADYRSAIEKVDSVTDLGGMQRLTRQAVETGDRALARACARKIIGGEAGFDFSGKLSALAEVDGAIKAFSDFESDLSTRKRLPFGW